MQCPRCGQPVGVTIHTPDYSGAYRQLKMAKDELARIPDSALKTTLENHITTAMKLLDGPLALTLH